MICSRCCIYYWNFKSLSRYTLTNLVSHSPLLLLLLLLFKNQMEDEEGLEERGRILRESFFLLCSLADSFTVTSDLRICDKKLFESISSISHRATPECCYHPLTTLYPFPLLYFFLLIAHPPLSFISLSSFISFLSLTYS